jgi:hypothetical protein
LAVTTDAVLADTVPTVIEEARYTEQFIAEMSGLVGRYTKELHDGKTFNLPYYGTVTARNLTEGVDNTTSETMQDTNVQVTPGEVGCKIILTDKLVRDDNDDVKRAAGRILGAAMEVKRDTDLLALFSSAAATTGGGGTATLGQIAAARALIRGNSLANGGPGLGPMACVLHPYVILDLADVFTPLVPAAGTTQNAAGALADEVVRNYSVGKIMGMPVIEDGNIDLATPAANSAMGGVFTTGVGGGMMLVTANEWSVEPERDASLRATELNIVGEYGVGLYNSRWVVGQSNDCATPT